MARFHLHSIILPYVSKLPVLVGVQAAHVNSARVSGGSVHQAPKARQKFAAEKSVIVCSLRYSEPFRHSISLGMRPHL